MLSTWTAPSAMVSGAVARPESIAVALEEGLLGAGDVRAALLGRTTLRRGRRGRR